MIRGITLRGAVALNVITMIGIGPLITIPLVLAQLGGALALIGWIAGALVALCDGLVCAELGSRFPGSGGTYLYLREIFGRERWGRLLAFLFNWQFVLSASFTIASGYIGFADYAGYIVPKLAASANLSHLLALGLGVLTIALLYRRITEIASIGTLLAAVAVVTLLAVGIAGFSHADFHRAFALTEPARFGLGFLAGLGGALYITLYDYAGYNEINFLGEEVREPKRTLPYSILWAVLIVFALYVFLQVGVLAAIPWQGLVGHAGAKFVGSTVVAQAWGGIMGDAVTVLILITAFASVYGGLLGASRVPFAAARDGAFLPAFARLHPTKQFPYVSLLAVGALSLLGSFFDLSFVIAVTAAAGILIGSIGQIVAFFTLRARGDRAPFRMWLFPVPALIALAGWVFAFANTGVLPIVLGIGWLLVGILVYLLTARMHRAWPFAAAIAAALLCAFPQPARAAQPPFVYGATFFYERIPASQWARALAQYRSLGINTIDLYVMWNWQEPRKGEFDFTGRTNPRRNLLGLFKLIHADGFAVILRPGPVIRNEWRNGGYPAWLLRRPAYDMPLRDVLQGRYPATATLQNEHSDAAAAQWMQNATHMRYATLWLRTVLHAVQPWQHDILAVALDDDQGAYLDNDTWPGPHFHRYIDYLASVVHGVYGDGMPVFINTYEMKVTASAPAWPWGNWYQSDAYSIGEHDRTQLEFATGLLQTQTPRRPLMVSEFQAGWLQEAGQARPRPADPSNTTLALHTMLQMGVHGIVNFPVQDTMNPAGWEAPWANAFYAWDAALSVRLRPQARYAPTARFGRLIARYGAQLARTHPAADAAIAYLTSAYESARMTGKRVMQIAQATMNAQHGCRIMRITCALIDLRYDSLARLRSYPVLILPPNPNGTDFVASVEAELRAYRATGGRIVASARRAHIAHPAAGGIPNAALLVAHNERYAFLDIVNYAFRPLDTQPAHVGAGGFSANVPALVVPARDAVLVPLGTQAPAVSLPPLGPGVRMLAPMKDATHAVAYSADVYRDGYPAVVLENRFIRLVVSPCAGARAFIFEDKASGQNIFTSIGGLRDAWARRLPPSQRDYIAPYTHPITTGTFNRCYAYHTYQRGEHASATFSYTAPDAPPHGARFSRTIAIDSMHAAFAVSMHARFPGSSSQRAQQLTSFATTSGTRIIQSSLGYGFYHPAAHRIALVAWDAGGVTAQHLERHEHNALLTLTFAAHRCVVRYGMASAGSTAQAQAALRAFTNSASSSAQRIGGVAER